VAAAAAATSTAIISDAIDVVHHESRNASAETLEDERKQKKEWKQKKENKRHRKDERKRHARDDEKRSRKHKRAKSSKRHRLDRSPSYSSSSYSSSGDESFDSRDRRSSKYMTRPKLNDYINTRDELLARAEEVFEWVRTEKLNIVIDKVFALDEGDRERLMAHGNDTS
jgi:hypothetical protein